MKKKILLIGSFGPGALENSYSTAFSKLDFSVIKFDISLSILKYCRIGFLGQKFNKFVPVEPWIRKANRELILTIKSEKPEILVVFGQNMILTSALAQIKAMFDIKAVYIWQDTLLFMGPNQINSLPLYDLICTYSNSNVQVLTNLGGRNVKWLPLAADPEMHQVTNNNVNFSTEFSFIGQWRPEREEVIAYLLKYIPDIQVKIWGPDWKRRSKNKNIINAWQGKSLFGREFAQAIASTKYNLNIIDDTNFPAANMRFFEIPCAGGLQICSRCPEMEKEFVNEESIFYYNDLKHLTEIISDLRTNMKKAEEVRKNGRYKVLKNHTYLIRAEQICNMV